MAWKSIDVSQALSTAPFDQAAHRFMAVPVTVVGGWVLIRMGMGIWLVGIGAIVYLGIVAIVLDSARKTLAGCGSRAPVRLEPQTEDAPDEVRLRQSMASGAFRKLGFRPLGLVVRDLLPGGPREYAALWVDPAGTTLAGVTSYVLKDRVVGDEARGVSTWFRDGMILETTTLHDHLPLDPKHDHVCLPMVRDLGTLIEIHRRRLRLIDQSSGGLRDFDGDAVDVVGRMHARVAEAALASGYLRMRDGGSDAVPTVWGVLRLATRHLSPIRDILRVIDRRRGEAVLRRIGFWEPDSNPTWTPWIAAGAGTVALVAGSSAALGMSAWATLGIVGAYYVQLRRGRRLGSIGVLAGGSLGVVMLMFVIGGGLGLQAGSWVAGGLTAWLLMFVNPSAWGPWLFVGGAAALHWGWTRMARGNRLSFAEPMDETSRVVSGP